MYQQESEVTEQQDNMRLDQVLAELFTDFSRSKLQSWLQQGLISVDGIGNHKSRFRVKSGSIIKIDNSAITKENELTKARFDYKPENIDLDIVYQDDDLIIINKPVNLVVHPAIGNWTGTLVNGLIYHFPELSSLPRAGIVHRLDKDTTGLMVVARNLAAHHSLVKQLQERSICRKYVALVQGHMISGGSIDAAIGRHPTNRIKMSVLDSNNHRAKSALTHYRVLKKFPKHSLVELKLSTGRTHQIRVHMAHLGYPIVGDALYGRVYAPPRSCSYEQLETWREFKRQALTAIELGLIHPTTKEYVHWRVDMPDDLHGLINILENISDSISTNNSF